MEQTAVLEDGVTQGKTQLESDYSIQYGGTLAQSSASSPHTHTHTSYKGKDFYNQLCCHYFHL
jgi:hypothetical protein